MSDRLGILVFLIVLPGMVWVGCGDSSVSLTIGGGSGDNYWARSFGEIFNESLRDVRPTSDGGAIFAGYTDSSGAGQDDAWIIKLSETGRVEWQRTYGGLDDDRAQSIDLISGGGYVFSGFTESFGAGGADLWVVRLDDSGNIKWQKAYGSSGGDESGFSILETSGGELIVAGQTTGLGADGTDDGWVLNLSSSGSVQWENRYGDGTGNEVERIHEIREISGGDFVATGRLDSAGTGGMEVWVIRLNSDGTIDWNRVYGKSGDERGLSVVETSSPSGFIVSGEEGIGSSDLNGWVLKLKTDGTIDWEKSYGDSGDESLFSVQQTSAGKFIFTGYTTSEADNSKTAGGKEELWLLRLTSGSDGDIDLDRVFGGTEDEIGLVVRQNSSEKFYIAAETSSFGEGSLEAWGLKVAKDGTLNPLGSVSSQGSRTLSPAVNTVANNRSATSSTVTNTSASVFRSGAIVYQQAP